MEPMEPIAPLNSWARRYFEMLEDGDPETFEAMKQDGTLYPTARQKGEDAADQFSTVLSQMKKRDPGPKSFLDKVQHLMVLESQAREVVLNDLYQPPPDDEM